MFVPCGDVEVQEPQPVSTWDRCGSGQPMRLTAVKSTRAGSFVAAVFASAGIHPCVAWSFSWISHLMRVLGREGSSKLQQTDISRRIPVLSWPALSLSFIYMCICLWAKRTRLVTNGLPDFGLLSDRDRLGLVAWTPWTIIIKQ